MTAIRATFTTPYTQHASRKGQRFEVVRQITEPDATHDAEALPMYVIRFDDGAEIEAFPEEVQVGCACRGCSKCAGDHGCERQPRGQWTRCAQCALGRSDV